MKADKNAIKQLSGLVKLVEKKFKEGRPVDIELNLENTGWVEERRVPDSQWKHFKDLGGREIDIHISIGNKTE